MNWLRCFLFAIAFVFIWGINLAWAEMTTGVSGRVRLSERVREVDGDAGAFGELSVTHRLRFGK